MKIAVLAGGLSPEREVSLSSGSLIANALAERGHLTALADVYFGIPAGTDPEKWFMSMAADKKVRDGKIVLILPERIGAVREEAAIPAATLRGFLREMCS